jgi:biotin carboxyl carrier protein
MTSRRYIILLGEEKHEVEVSQADNGFQIQFNGKTHQFVPLANKPPLFSFLLNDSEVIEADITWRQDQCELNLHNIPYKMEVFDPRRRIISQGGAEGGSGLISSPMPGKIIDIKVKPGDLVKKGDPVIIIEAMKMQNELGAPIDGTVKEISVKQGAAVESGQKLVLIDKK